jgi:signal transduction histidine kinase
VPVVKLKLPPNQSRPGQFPGTRSGRAVDSARSGAELSPVAALAHDLRSPLAAVLGFARLAREDLRAGDALRAAGLIERIERSAAMLEAILECALDDRGRANAADLGSVLEQIRAERKRDLERRGIRLVSPESWPALAVNPAALYRLVNNLVGNAIDHMGYAIVAPFA